MSVKPDEPRSSWGHDDWWTWLDAEGRKGDVHALASAEQALEAFPQSAVFHSIRGKTLTTLGRIDEARAALERARELDPGDGATCIRLAWVCVRQGRFQDAARWIESATGTADAQHEFAPWACGLYMAMGDYANALRLLPHAIAHAPSDVLLEHHHQALRRLTEDAEAGVAPRFKRAYLLALEHLATGEPAAAEALLRKVIRHAPDFPQGWMALRGALEAQGLTEQARALRPAWIARAAPRLSAHVELGMSRRLGSRGLIFDPRDPIPVVASEAALARAPDPEALKSGKDSILVLDPGGKTVRHDPVISLDDDGSDKVSVSFVTGPKWVAALEHAALAGSGVVITSDGKAIRELLPPARASKFDARLADRKLLLQPHRFNDGLCPTVVHDTPAFLMAGATDTSFGDWIVNFAPRLALAEAARLDCPIVIRRDPPRQVFDILSALGVKRERIIFHDPQGVSLFPRLYVPSWPSEHKDAPSEGVFDIYRRAALPPAAGRRPLLYLTRRSIAQRRMVNEAEVCELFARRGFEIVDPGALSFAAVRRLFANPACVAGPFGSAFHNLVFCGGKPTNLVILPSNTPFLLTEIALWQGELGQRFVPVRGRSLPDERLGYSAKHAPWIAPLDQVERAIDKVLELIQQEPG